MEFSVLEPTKENILKVIKDNLIGRNEEAYSLASFCHSLDKRTSIAIEAPWGSGKTFFIKQTKMLLDACNQSISSLDEEEINLIKSKMLPNDDKSKENLENNYICVYYDAWDNDDEDPLLSIIYEIVRTTGIDYKIKESKGIVESGKILADFVSKGKINKLLELFEKDDLLQSIKTQKDIQQRIEDFINKLLEEKGSDSRLILFIDELDRCNPKFAVHLLERIKHCFTNEHVTIIYSINLLELTHTINNVYGADFDANRYLDKFFDWRFSLLPVNIENYYNKKEDYSTSSVADILFDKVCHQIIKQYNLTIREFIDYKKIVDKAYKTMQKGEPNNYRKAEIKQLWALSLGVILPLAVILRMVDNEGYNEFISGERQNYLTDIIIKSDIYQFLLDDNKKYDSSDKENIEEHPLIQSKIKEIYQKFCDPNSTVREQLNQALSF